jgi:transposase
MRYELTDREWFAIRPMLPNKPRGVPRVNDRRVLNGILWVLRSGAPWRDLPNEFGPYTTCRHRQVLLPRLNHDVTSDGIRVCKGPLCEQTGRGTGSSSISVSLP